MIYIKGVNSFVPQANFSPLIQDPITLSVNIAGPLYTGSVTSPKFGPAKKWNSVHWRGTDLTSPATDTAAVQVIGIDTLGNFTQLYSLSRSTQDFDISGMNAAQYPFLQLNLISSDSVLANPFLLNYWGLNYVPEP
jgi:hypothetical protein